MTVNLEKWSKAIEEIAAILKEEFPNLTVIDTLKITTSIVNKVITVMEQVD